ncbi:DUF1987 domain-containing protein [Paracoccaceae bacterium]|nr:DUF1987 domain-containing protein [Paracoccaceae bacterium]
MTENLSKGSEKTPSVDISGSDILIAGRSYPEDLHAFWDDIVSKLENKIQNCEVHKLIFDVSYHNSGTTRIFVNLLKFIEAADAVDVFEVIWRFDEEDEQTEEQGEDYQLFCKKASFKLESY